MSARKLKSTLAVRRNEEQKIQMVIVAAMIESGLRIMIRTSRVNIEASTVVTLMKVEKKLTDQNFYDHLVYVF